MMTTKIHVSRFPSPVGPLSLATMDNQLVHLDFEDNEARMHTLQGRRFRDIHWREQPGSAPAAVIEWLEAYFDGVLQPLPLSHIRLTGTEFQQQVWQGLTGIPAGQHRSYGALAETLGNPRAVRAVARANALNPVAILIPCHRVIGANGTLTGYAGGLERKAWLLDHEAANLRAG
ncbi:methylated-DNA--[protein]-cysteine S-methyltransferase [Marinobacter sp.]|uniref:methylated-DNA--[protein]-cysteine S-methyltransferase n=1 Tax=Marinobacter sp. TaxID=50741 RepID=UPI0034A1D203